MIFGYFVIKIADDGEIIGVPAGWEPVGKPIPLNTYEPYGWKIVAIKRGGGEMATVNVCAKCNQFFDTDRCPYCIQEKPENDPINSPAHYTQGIEAIDYILSWKMNYLEGNIIKYITRYKFKNGIEDLKKARWYIDRLIDFFSKDSDRNDNSGEEECARESSCCKDPVQDR
jgi:hypothetical protein